MTEPEPWMKAAAELAHEYRHTGDEAGCRRVMNAAEARCDREAAEIRAKRQRDQ